jgi:hypothetical protein
MPRPFTYWRPRRISDTECFAAQAQPATDDRPDLRRMVSKNG